MELAGPVVYSEQVLFVCFVRWLCLFYLFACLVFLFVCFPRSKIIAWFEWNWQAQLFTVSRVRLLRLLASWARHLPVNLIAITSGQNKSTTTTTTNKQMQNSNKQTNNNLLGLTLASQPNCYDFRAKQINNNNNDNNNNDKQTATNKQKQQTNNDLLGSPLASQPNCYD